MITGLMFIGIIILLGFFVLMFVIGGYNALVTLRNRYKNAYSQIDVQLKRRYDLKPSSQQGMPPSRLIPAPQKIRATLLL